MSLLVIVNDNNLQTNKMLKNRLYQNNTFILNKNSIHDDVMKIHLRNSQYNHIVNLISSSNQFNSTQEESSFYLKCNHNYKCNFEITFIVMNKTCMSIVDCPEKEISSNLNYEKLESPLIFILNGDSNNDIQSMFDSLLEVNKNVASFHDIIIFNNNPAIETISCEKFTDSFITKVHTKQNHKNMGNIYYLHKSQKEDCLNFTRDVKIFFTENSFIFNFF
jgi:hypothetical protein